MKGVRPSLSVVSAVVRVTGVEATVADELDDE
jgi:hypothetical protein